MIIRELTSDEANVGLFRGFIRHQVVTRCLRRENGEWVAKDIAFTEEWGESDYLAIADEIKTILESGGRCAAAFESDALVGFAYISNEEYLDYAILVCMQVSEPYRGRGLGRLLFGRCKDFAREKGKRRLYISAHSSVESQAFYMKMGCVDAEHVHARLAELEPGDRQLECLV